MHHPLHRGAEDLAARLVARMTTDEKLAQLLNTAPAIERLDVPSYNWWTESLHGAMGSLPTTNFPRPERGRRGRRPPGDARTLSRLGGSGQPGPGVAGQRAELTIDRGRPVAR